ncbi:MAG TPA: amidohydrolase family protein [Candidatus Binatia bacterium]
MLRKALTKKSNIASGLRGPAKCLVIQGGTLIDATGAPPLQDPVIVIEGERIKSIGKKGELVPPKGGRVIDARGKTILPGFIDGHGHYEDFAGEIYLHLGVTTCPDIQTTRDDYWSMAQRDGIKAGKIRGPRIWSAGKAVGQTSDTSAMGGGRRGSFPIKSPEDGREMVRWKKKMGLDQIKIGEALRGETLKAVVDEAHRLGFSAIAHSMDVLASAEAGVNAVEHHWSVGLSSIADPEKKAKIIADRWQGRLDTEEMTFYYEPENFDRLIEIMIKHNVSWSPTIGTWFRPLSPSAARFRRRELSILNNPKAKYLPEVLRAITLGPYDKYRKWPSEKLDRIKQGYENVLEFMRRFARAGGLVRAGSDPNHGMPALDIHEEVTMFVEGGLTPMQALQSATINVAKTFGKDRDFGTVEPGKIADMIMINGDPLKDSWATQNVQMVISGGNVIDHNFHADYKNPIPSPEPWRNIAREIDIAPRSIPQGSKPPVLTVKATAGRVARWHKIAIDGNLLETRFISSTELQAKLTPQAIKNAGTFPVTVVSPRESGGHSNPAHLIVTFVK